ncbi:MAG: molybdopterin molybdotransferase MoeA [Saprospiraceae bacterium]
MEFIHYKEALQKIREVVLDLGVEYLPLSDSIHRYVAEDIMAPIDIPPFDNSAMDGYGFSIESLSMSTFYPIIHEVKAGSFCHSEILPGQAIRIYTGAPVPKGVNLVVMKEHCFAENNQVKITDGAITKGLNIRPKGSQSQKGQNILQKNTKITAGVIGFLAGFGINTIPVYKVPRVGVIVTGDELVKPGITLRPGQIYESNSIALLALLREMHMEPLFVHWVEDTLEKLSDEISQVVKLVDVLLLTGGISVGDYDFVQPALQKNGFERIFYKIKQRPGKPLFFGRKNEVVVFALPGNPASVYTCFQVYVKPFLKNLCSGNQYFQEYHKGKLLHDFEKKKGLTHWLKSIEKDGKIKILQGQESYKMDSIAAANCLAILEEEIESLKAGSVVSFIKI